MKILFVIVFFFLFLIGTENLKSQALPTPTLISPTQGATNVSRAPILDWFDVPNAISYRLQLSHTADFTQIIIDSSGIISSQFFVSDTLLGSFTHHWRVRAYGIYQLTPYSQIYHFRTVPAIPIWAPSLYAPLNYSLGVSTTPKMRFSFASSEDNFQIQISTNSNFSNVIYDKPITGDSTVIPPGILTYQSKYYWRAREFNISGYGPFCSPWIFTTTFSPLLAPILLSPSDSSIDLSLTPFLWWQILGGSNSYNIQIASDLKFSNIVYSQNSTDLTHSVFPGNLLANKTYFWRVRGISEVGYSAFSTIRKFKTVPSGISSPVLIAPLNGQYGVLLNPTLIWSSIPGSTGYSFIVSRNIFFMDTIYSHTVDTNFFTLPLNLLQINTLHYWKVRSIDLSGYGIFSNVWSFTSRPTGIFNIISEIIPTDYKLFYNYPNPFNPLTKIKFNLPKSSMVKLIVFDINGRVVQEILNENLHAGAYETEFNGANLSSGIYYYRIEANDFSETKKMILIK